MTKFWSEHTYIMLHNTCRYTWETSLLYSKAANQDNDDATGSCYNMWRHCRCSTRLSETNKETNSARRQKSHNSLNHSYLIFAPDFCFIPVMGCELLGRNGMYIIEMYCYFYHYYCYYILLLLRNILILNLLSPVECHHFRNQTPTRFLTKINVQLTAKQKVNITF